MNKRWKAFSEKGPQYNRIRIDMEAADRALKKALKVAMETDFSSRPDLTEFMTDTLAKARARLDQLDERFRR